MPEREALLRHPWSQFQEGVHYTVSAAGCWEWNGVRDSKGYGHGPKLIGERLAHRASFALVHGALEPGGHVHHKCENKCCINPAHLEHLPPTDHRRLHSQAESTLTWDDVRAIREANKAGVGIYDLAEVYGLSIGTLHPLILNRTWVDPDYEPGFNVDCEECATTFRTTRVNKRFCSKACQRTWNSRRTGRRSRGQNPDGSETRSWTRRAA